MNWNFIRLTFEVSLNSAPTSDFNTGRKDQVNKIEVFGSMNVTFESKTTLIKESGILGPLINSPDAKVHYDSSVTFSTRRYSSLDVRFSRIILNFPIGQALSSSKIYCQSVVSRQVTNALIKIDNYGRIKSIRDFSGKLTFSIVLKIFPKI